MSSTRTRSTPPLSRDRLIVASQLEPEFNARIRAHPSAPEVIDVPPDQPRALPVDADAIIIRPNPGWRTYDAAPAGWPGRIRWIQTSSSGIDAFPSWLLNGPAISSGRGVASDQIADYVIAAIYQQAKNLDACRVRAADQWRKVPSGHVRGSTLGIVGLGAIGEAVAEAARGLGMRIVAVRRDRNGPRVAGVEIADSLLDLFAQADHIVLALPSTPATRGLISAEILAAARPGAHLINVARGSVLDQDALIAALDAGALAFATLDVTEPEPLPAGHPIYTHERIRLTPHISSNYLSVRERLYAKVLENFDRFLNGEPLLDQVNPATGY
jgi:phosphoglycerate dehydrogenase-like enzyme